MAPLLEDPRIRQTWNQLSQNAETATETAAAGIWSFQHNYVNPCFSSIAAGFEQCAGQCFPDRDERARRLRDRGRTRGRAELSFDFYDDWDEDEGIGGGGLLGGWGNDELDRLLAGSGSHSGNTGGMDQAPRRKRGMSYGTNRGRQGRKSLEPDPTIIPSTNSLGFLGRLPFKLGGTLRYKPSAADLQDHPGAPRSEFVEDESEPFIPDDESDEEPATSKGHARQRSSTTSSGETSDSFRSRGDLFPSDGEDDAVPLSDEFAMVLERRTTNANTDDKSSGKTRSSKGKKRAGSSNVSGNLTRAPHSSQSVSALTYRTSSPSLTETPVLQSPGLVEVPSLTDLQQEEDRLRMEEEEEVERKRQAAAKLAMERGLHAGESTDVISEQKEDSSMVENTSPPRPMKDKTEHITPTQDTPAASTEQDSGQGFVPARLPNFH